MFGRELRELINLQREWNKIRIKQLDYKEGLPVPTVGWKINEKDIECRKKEISLSNLYRDTFLNWKDRCDNNNHRFGSSPVKSACWECLPSGACVWRGKVCKDTPIAKIVPFSRYENLMPQQTREYYDLVLVKSLLGFQPIFNENKNFILNEAWTVKLKSTEKENCMMDSFLRGIGEAVKEQHEGKTVVGVDVTDELKDLFRVYTDADDHLKRKEAEALISLSGYMKRFLDVQEERKKVVDKLHILKAKIMAGESYENDEEEDD